MTSPARSDRRPALAAASVAVAALVLAVLALVWAVGMAERTLEPWGDSPRAFYAVVADVLLGFGTVLLALAVRGSRPQIVKWRLPNWLEPLVYIASCVVIAVPLAIAGNNTLEASSIGEGGPPLALVVVAGVGFAAALALLMRRAIRFGFFAAIVLGGALTAFALIAAR